MATATGSEWWRTAVVYQIYPRSFQDSTGDGIGDLQGIIDRLDYLNDGTAKSLGVDAIWLSPTFPSPMKDFGYDVSDYEGVHPDFGSLETMDRLIEECHRREMKLLLDFVPNHTSNEHPWFVDSRSSRTSRKRDWYVWRDAKPDGSLPNNWFSVFGGPAWELDADTGQYYLHSFLVEQPDLNWRNPDVVAAMHDVLRFWLARGIDGFRIDVMGMVVKHPELADNPPNPRWTDADGEHNSLLPVNNLNYPDVFPAVKGIRSVLDEFGETMAVGEVFGSARQIGEFYGGEDLKGLHLAFNFQLIHEHGEAPTPWTAEAIRRVVSRAERDLPAGAQPCFALGNHDRSRFISRNDLDGFGEERARAAIVLLIGLRSTPFIYYGEEIGMTDVEIPTGQLQDPARLRTTGRDPERTPMQWTADVGRGFTTGTPWLPFGEPEINVASQDADDDSMLNLYRRAIWLRKREESLRSGSYREVDAPPGAFAFVRHTPGHAPIFVALSTSTENTAVQLPEGYDRVLLATDLRAEGRFVEGEITLPPLAAIMVAGPQPHAV